LSTPTHCAWTAWCASCAARRSRWWRNPSTQGPCATRSSRSRSRWGPIDILVNTSDEPAPARIEAIDPEAWRFTMARNLDAAYNWSRRALPSMKQRNWGRIVNMVSLAAKGAADGGAADAASQSGLVALTFALAREAAATA
jgi:3-hydroxybutyrate dehydrogenase